MDSPSNLEKLVGQLLPQLTAEIGAVHDEIRNAAHRLGRVPPALLQDPGKIPLDRALAALHTADEEILACLQHLHRQRPGHGER